MASDLHKELSIRAISWMNSRMTQSGIRWATEFYLKEGWVADCVAFGFPQIRFFDKIKKLHNQQEVHDVWKKNGYPHSFLHVFESKVSKQDYYKSFGKDGKTGYKSKMIGHLHYIITPKGLITENILPEGWGWLVKSGNGLREMKTPQLHKISDEYINQIGYRMLWSAYGRRASIEDWELKRGQLF